MSDINRHSLDDGDDQTCLPGRQSVWEGSEGVYPQEYSVRAAVRKAQELWA